MRRTKKMLALAVSLFFVFGMAAASVVWGASTAQAASGKTGTGLAEHAVKAYQEGWKYNYGSYGEFIGSTRASDCTGLIKSYLWWTDDNSNPQAGSIAVAGGAKAMLTSASESGTIDYSDPSSLPRVHGLILYQPGHVGVYVGNNMAVDNRDVGLDVKYEQVFGRAKPKWTTWFKLPQIEYPTTGWAVYNGQNFYYENGEYLVSTTRTIGGVTYQFGADGVAVQTSGTAAGVSSTAEETAPESVPEEREQVSSAVREEPVSQIEQTASAAVAQAGVGGTAVSDPVSEENPSAQGTGTVSAGQGQTADSSAVSDPAVSQGSTSQAGLTVSQPDAQAVSEGSASVEELPKAAANPISLGEASQTVRGMSSFLAAMIVFLTMGIGILIGWPIWSRQKRSGRSRPQDRFFRHQRNKL